MKKRKMQNFEASTRKKKNLSSTDEKVAEPEQRIAKDVVQEFIKQEILAVVKQSDDFMQELIGRVQKIESTSKYETMISKLQMKISKLKRREEAALEHVRKMRLTKEQCADCVCPSPQALRSVDDSTSSHTPHTQASHLCCMHHSNSEETTTSQDPSSVDEDREVVFCGVQLPKRRLIEGFWQKQHNRMHVVDLTFDDDNARASENITERDDSESPDTTELCTVPTQSPKPSKQTVSCYTQTTSPPVPVEPDSQTPFQGECTPVSVFNGTETSPSQSCIQDDWCAEVPPLPVSPFPGNMPSVAAMTNLPQKLDLKVGNILQPKSIGLVWTVQQPDLMAAPLESYHLYITQESSVDGTFSNWRRIGAIRPLPLPMACRVSDFSPGRRFCFTIVGKDIYGRYGPFSEVKFIRTSNG